VEGGDSGLLSNEEKVGKFLRLRRPVPKEKKEDQTVSPSLGEEQAGGKLPQGGEPRVALLSFSRSSFSQIEDESQNLRNSAQ